MLLVDKYKINSLHQIEYNKSIYSKLFPHFENRYFKTSDINFCLDYHMLNNKNEIIKNIKNINDPKELYKYLTNLQSESNKPNNLYNDLPNLLISGYPGAGKTAFIKLLLEEIYDKKISHTDKVKYSIVGYGNTSVDVLIEQSNYHIVIEPNNTGFDKYIIQEIVKEYAKKYIIPTNNVTRGFKIILINNVDNLSYYAQTSLRCTMEKYYNSCKFILCGKQISKIIDPIRSRCLNILFPNPNRNEIFNIIYDIAIRENININDHSISKIIEFSKGNITSAKWLLQLRSCNIDNYVLSYKTYIHKIIKIIKDFYHNNAMIKPEYIIKIRNILYTIFINNITASIIIKELLDQLITTCYDFDNILLKYSFYLNYLHACTHAILYNHKKS